MSDTAREVKRNRKIARTLIRLKHTLAADDEIEAYIEREREALLSNKLPSLDSTLSELTGQ